MEPSVDRSKMDVWKMSQPGQLSLVIVLPAGLLGPQRRAFLHDGAPAGRDFGARNRAADDAAVAGEREVYAAAAEIGDPAGLAEALLVPHPVRRFVRRRVEAGDLLPVVRDDRGQDIGDVSERRRARDAVDRDRDFTGLAGRDADRRGRAGAVRGRVAAFAGIPVLLRTKQQGLRRAESRRPAAGRCRGHSSRPERGRS